MLHSKTSGNTVFNLVKVDQQNQRDVIIFHCYVLYLKYKTASSYYRNFLSSHQERVRTEIKQYQNKQRRRDFKPLVA